MRGFNKVFGIVKRHCQENSAQDTDCYEMICRELNIDEHTLSIYLNILQNMRLITYDAKNKGNIRLTLLGEQTTDIPSTLS